MALFGDPGSWPTGDQIAVSGPPDAATVLQSYREGVFPMRFSDRVPLQRLMAWYSPERRGILPLDRLKVSKSLRASARRYTLTVDTDFAGVLDGCADPQREHGWIDRQIRTLYGELFDRGVVHTVETRDAERRLVGGLYGVSVGGLFAGESMFHDPVRGRDASKAALVALVDLLRGGTGAEAEHDGGASDAGELRLLDVQWRTDHLASLGVVEVARPDYLARLRRALTLPPPDWSAWGG